MVTRYTTDAQNVDLIDKTAIVGESAGIAALGVALWGASKLLSPSVTNAKVSRRRFLRKSLAVATGVATAGSILRLETPNIANISNEPTEEFLQHVANALRPRIARSLFFDGRTALLLAKAEDAQATVPELSQATNVVVMGSGHVDIAPTYMQDRGERNRSIAAYAQELLDIAKQVYGTYYHVSPEQIRNYLPLPEEWTVVNDRNREKDFTESANNAYISGIVAARHSLAASDKAEKIEGSPYVEVIKGNGRKELILPMSLSEAEGFVSRILSQWLASKQASQASE